MRDLQKVFLLLPDINLKLTSRIIQALVKKDTFIGEQKLYEILRAFVVKKNLDKQMLAFLNRYVQTVLQFGLFQRMFTNIPNWTVLEMAKEGGRDGFMTYLSLSDFIEKNTFIGPLPFSKLDYFFRAYIVLQSLLVVTCLIHSLLSSSLVKNAKSQKFCLKKKSHLG